MERKYLAYFALLAGWIGFCLWFYSHAIFPKLKPQPVEEGVIRMTDLDMPVGFKWGSDVPLAGRGFDDWKQSLVHSDSLREVILLKGYYYQDESGSHDGGFDLAKRRIDHVVDLLKLPDKRILNEIQSREITSDVRSLPFAAVEVSKIGEDKLWHMLGDTAEVCFPLADTLLLPEIILGKMENWMQVQRQMGYRKLGLIGTADGTGIVESSDLAIDRAMMIRDWLVKKGLPESNFEMNAEQRNNTDAVQNRCVMIYFEKAINE